MNALPIATPKIKAIGMIPGIRTVMEKASPERTALLTAKEMRKVKVNARRMFIAVMMPASER